jgi:hypothetical protein
VPVLGVAAPRRASRWFALAMMAVLVTAGCRGGRGTATKAPAAAVAFERDVLALTLAYGTRASASIPVVGPRAAAAHLVPRPATHPSVRARVLRPDAVIAVDVTAAPEQKGLPVGTHVGNIVVDTGLPEAPTLTLPYSIRVTGTLEVSPTNPLFNLRDPAAHARTIVVRSRAAEPPAFAVREARVTSGPFTATVEKAGPGLFHVHVHVDVHVNPAAVPADERGVLGRLVITSNDPTEPSKEIPLLALGRMSAGAGADAGAAAP